jgi:hypothetical protein
MTRNRPRTSLSSEPQSVLFGADVVVLHCVLRTAPMSRKPAEVSARPPRTRKKTSFKATTILSLQLEHLDTLYSKLGGTKLRRSLDV